VTQRETQHRRHPRLLDLVQGLETVRVLNAANPIVTAIVDDSREVAPGALFVAVGGTRVDGHTYIGQAADRGAAAVVCEHLPSPAPACPVIQVHDSRHVLSALADAYFGSPSRRLRVTGVTGTDGKTSTTYILRAILAEAGHPAGAIGTLGYAIGESVLDSDLTTPGPIPLHEAFDRMLHAGLTDVCMEVSSHSLAMGRVAHVAFDAAALTNITQDHLDFHVTREDYARAKRTLFEALPPDSVAVLPAEGEFSRSFAEATDAEVLTYSTTDLADVRGRVLSMGMDGMEIAVRTPFESYQVRTSLIGTYNCQNILAAATVAFGFGIDGGAVRQALRGFRGVPGRLERVRVPGRTGLPGVVVDYAHTPGALDKVLGTLRPLVGDKLICLIGCGGDRDATKRPIMGRIATERADVAVFTADNSRSERTESIIDQMVAGIASDLAVYRIEPDRRRAVELAVSLARSPGCMVALCGRGCERYQKLAGRNIAFDDRVVAREVMERLPVRHRKTG
jgi:UDP-N-acetylmuramoyl-L-alanyl-D-glutamate--2,6-diaminopimelate ligase